MDSPLTCPYCNTRIAGPAAGVRPTCPRCGEPLPTAPAATGATSSATPATGDRRVEQASTSTPTGLSNRTLAGIILGVMLAMFLIGLGYALWTASVRNQRHPQPSTELEITSPNPPELPGLGYLPRDVNLIAALRPADLLESAVGKTLLAAPRPVILDKTLGAVERWTGLKPEDIDHLIAGTTLTAEPFPLVVLVVQTRRPYDLVSLATALKSKYTLRYDRPLFLFDLASVGKGYLWSPKDRIMVLVLRLLGGVAPADLDNIPRDPWPALESLQSAKLRGVLDRLGKESLAWFAVHLPDPAVLNSVLGPWQPKGDIDTFAKRSDALGLWLVPDKNSIEFSGAFHGRTDTAAAELKELLARRSISGMSIRVDGGPAKDVPAADALWVNLQMRGPAAKVRELLQTADRLLPPAFSVKGPHQLK